MATQQTYTQEQVSQLLQAQHRALTQGGHDGGGGQAGTHQGGGVADGGGQHMPTNTFVVLPGPSGGPGGGVGDRPSADVVGQGAGAGGQDHGPSSQAPAAPQQQPASAGTPPAGIPGGTLEQQHPATASPPASAQPPQTQGVTTMNEALILSMTPKQIEENASLIDSYLVANYEKPSGRR